MLQFIPIGARVNSAVSAPNVQYTIPPNANGALVQAITQDVNISIDPASPATASDGMRIKAGDPVRLLPLGSGKTFTAQQVTATAAFYVQFVKVVWVPLS